MGALKMAGAVLHRISAPLLWIAAGIGLFVAVAVPTRMFALSLREPALVSGYVLLALVGFLLLFNVRKRIPILPALRASTWKRAHVFAGVLALAVFWLHTGEPWPAGEYERALAALFYVVTASGALGYVYQKVFPRRLTQSGVEVIFERLPSEIVALRARAEEIALHCTTEQSSDTLARFYVQTLQWYFRKPRFLLNHLWGGQRASFWISQQCASAQRYLGEKELIYLREIEDLAYAKARLDLHYAAQGLLKLWLILHVPLAMAMLALALWHMLLVHIYAL